MKNFLTCCLICISTFGFAQKKQVQPLPSIQFYGIDFSQVNVIGSRETKDKFLTAFSGINQLLINEAKKYDIGQTVKANITQTSVEIANKGVADLANANFINAPNKEINISDMIKPYCGNGETGLVIIAKELNKTTNTGTFIYAFFNGETQKITKQETISGKAKGFGLRNFWAGALYDSMESYAKMLKKIK
ncbi:MAG: hypothetical protein RR555_03590 [Bacteroidales bacterium]